MTDIPPDEGSGSGSGSSLPLPVLLVAGISTLIAVLVSAMSIYLHLKNYLKPSLQRRVPWHLPSGHIDIRSQNGYTNNDHGSNIRDIVSHLSFFSRGCICHWCGSRYIWGTVPFEFQWFVKLKCGRHLWFIAFLFCSSPTWEASALFSSFYTDAHQRILYSLSVCLKGRSTSVTRTRSCFWNEVSSVSIWRLHLL